MYVIGLTGNIASGKTIAARRLEALGARVICADEAARRVVCPGSEGLRRVGEAFGDGVIRPDGSLDRAALGRVVFGDAFDRKRLEAILHPLIIEDILQTLGAWEKEAPGAIAVVDAALLFETGLDEYAGEVWLVEARDDIRLRRIMDRDGLSENEARARMNLPRDPNGDELAMPLNMLPAGAVSALPEDDEEPADDDEEPADDEDVNTRALSARERKADGEVDPSQPELRRRHEEKWRQTLARTFSRQRDAVLGKFPKGRAADV